MPSSVAVALGSNLGDREWLLRRAIQQLGDVIHLVRVSRFIETKPVDAPPPSYVNAVVVGYTDRSPCELLLAFHAIETRLGRRRTTRNAPRTIDIDLILYSATLMRTDAITLPHPRYLSREFVRGPMRELGLGWRDPVSGVRL